MGPASPLSSRHRERRPAVLLTSFVLAASLGLLGAAPASAGCDVLDPGCVDETVEDTTGSVTETTDDLTGGGEGTVEEVVEDPSGTVEGPVEDVTGTVEEVMEDPAGTIQDVTRALGDPGEDLPDPVGGIIDDLIAPASPPTAPGAEPGSPPTEEMPPPSSGPGGIPGGAGSAGGGGGNAGPTGGVQVGFASSSATLGAAATASDPARGDPVGLQEGLAGPVGELAGRLAFPVGLAALVVLFLAIQNRLDRRDPKLALAGPTPDLVPFEAR